jgi:hypothetical protein
MVALIITFPGLVTGGLAKKATVNTDQIQIEVPEETPDAEGAPLEGQPDSGPKTKGAGKDDAEGAIERAMAGKDTAPPAKKAENAKRPDAKK